jgi:Family of unknown function (DUF5906)
MSSQHQPGEQLMSSPDITTSAPPGNNLFTGTFFNSIGARFKSPFAFDAVGIIDRYRRSTAPSKDQLPWIKLAEFGALTSGKQSLRHDANVIAVTGVEGDYDGEKMSFDTAIDLIKTAQICALLYTSPSHKPDKPRWRVLCPFEGRWHPGHRVQMLARLNGVLGGVLSVESFTLSQSYYFGRLDDGEEQIVFLDGDKLDTRPDLDARAIGKNQKKANGLSTGNGHTEFTDLDELRARIVSGEALHTSVTSIAGTFARNRVPKDMAISYVRGAFDDADDPRYEGRWQECREAVDDIYAKEESKQTALATTSPVAIDTFYFHSKENKFIYIPNGALWPRASIVARVPPVGRLSAATIIAAERAVEDATWWPGKPQILHNDLVVKGGLIEKSGARTFNFYRPPAIVPGRADGAKLYLDHVRTLYPDDADHILKWFAYRVRHPNIKINHALVLGGAQGIGKDTLLYPMIAAVGYWNTDIVSPHQVMEKFNACIKSVLLIITEARDMGEINRPMFYEYLKNVIAAPPDVLEVNEKNVQKYYVPNLTGVVLTTNHKADGIFLPADDRRHYVAWTELTRDAFAPGYFEQLWTGYLNGSLVADIGAMLRGLDLSGFDPKLAPRQTPAFWEIVGASQHPETSDLDSVLTRLGAPDLVTLDDLTAPPTDAELVVVLKRNRRMMTRWMEDCGYKAVRNPGDKQGSWSLSGRKQTVYGKKTISNNELMRKIRARQI